MKIRLLATALAVAFSTACSGAGQSMPAAPGLAIASQAAPELPATQIESLSQTEHVSIDADTTMTVLNAFNAVDPSNGTRIHFLPTIDVMRSMTQPLALNNMLYHGGPVQTVPHIYLILWGSNWTSAAGDPALVQPYLKTYFSHIGGTHWLNSVSQYTQAGGLHVGNAAGSFRGSWLDVSRPPSSPTQSQLAAEALRAAGHFGDRTVNANYIIALPKGVKPPGFGTTYCAYHSYALTSAVSAVPYTNLPYLADATEPCGAFVINHTSAGIRDGVAIVAGHEQGETETDPWLNAWYDKQFAENGDKCAWIHLIDNPAANGFPTQPLWSNRTASCVQSF